MHRKVGSSQASHKIVGIDRWRPWLPILALGLRLGGEAADRACSCTITRCSSRTSGLDTTAYVDLANAVRRRQPGSRARALLPVAALHLLPRGQPDVAALVYRRSRPAGHARDGVGRVHLPDDAGVVRASARRGMRRALAAVTGLLTFYEAHPAPGVGRRVPDVSGAARADVRPRPATTAAGCWRPACCSASRR